MTLKHFIVILVIGIVLPHCIPLFMSIGVRVMTLAVGIPWLSAVCLIVGGAGVTYKLLTHPKLQDFLNW